MALQLNYETSSGVVGNYWRVNTYDTDTLKSVARVEVRLYKDKAARDAGKSPLLAIPYNWEGADFCFSTADLNPLDMNPVKKAYEKLKTLTTPIDFTQAIDV